MPELPEVQTVVDDLNKKVLGRKITGIWLDWPKAIKDPLDQSKTKIAHKHVEIFKKSVVGKKILSVKRRAKNILIYLSGDFLILIHQKMTGHMLVGRWQIAKGKTLPIEPRAVVDDPYNRFIHLLFYLDNGQMLALSDVRKFAKAILGKTKQIENLPELVRLGPEPLDSKFKYENFQKIISSEHRKIKQVLMDPEVIAGIGNIYSDEILWEAKIHPLKPANKLNSVQLKTLWSAMRKILAKAVRLRGTSSSDFRDTAGEKGSYTNVLLVYQREGELCYRCKTKIQRLKSVGGRSAHFCPQCQKI
jgi:formamidopyrimidine-DNA glycosylase